MSKYTLSDFDQLMRMFIAANGHVPATLPLPAHAYIELLQDCWQAVLRVTAIPPTPVEFSCQGVIVTPYNAIGSTITSWDDILTEYGRLYAANNPTSQLSNYMQLDIGPWRYAVLLPRVSPYISWQPTTVTNPAVVPSPPPPPAVVASAVSEPACMCSSRALVTIGHEQGCRWLLWKSMRGAK